MSANGGLPLNKESRSSVKLWVWILYYNDIKINLVSIFCKYSEKTTKLLLRVVQIIYNHVHRNSKTALTNYLDTRKEGAPWDWCSEDFVVDPCLLLADSSLRLFQNIFSSWREGEFLLWNMKIINQILIVLYNYY